MNAKWILGSIVVELAMHTLFTIVGVQYVQAQANNLAVLNCQDLECQFGISQPEVIRFDAAGNENFSRPIQGLVSGRPLDIAIRPNGDILVAWSTGRVTDAFGNDIVFPLRLDIAAAIATNDQTTQQFALTVNKTGAGTGTVSSSPGGIDCGSTCSSLFDEGQVVTLTAVPDPGFTLSEWSGSGCTGGGACTVTIDSDKTVTANFRPILPDPPPPTCSAPDYQARLFGDPFVFRYTARASAGLASIVETHSAAASVSIPTFMPGTTDPVVITVTRAFGLSATFTLQIRDNLGRITPCFQPTTRPSSFLSDISLGPPVVLQVAAEDEESGLCEVRARVRESGGTRVEELVPITPNQIKETVPVTISGKLVERLTLFDCAGNFSFFDVRTQVIVDSLVVPEGAVSTSYDPSPVSNAQAGVFTILAKFRNISSETIFMPFFQVFLLTGGNLLLNADGGPGGLGATMTPQGSATVPFPPGTVGTFQFDIGLQKREPFTFFVDLLGRSSE